MAKTNSNDQESVSVETSSVLQQAVVGHAVNMVSFAMEYKATRDAADAIVSDAKQAVKNAVTNYVIDSINSQDNSNTIKLAHTAQGAVLLAATELMPESVTGAMIMALPVKGLGGSVRAEELPVAGAMFSAAETRIGASLPSVTVKNLAEISPDEYQRLALVTWQQEASAKSAANLATAEQAGDFNKILQAAEQHHQHWRVQQLLKSDHAEVSPHVVRVITEFVRATEIATQIDEAAKVLEAATGNTASAALARQQLSNLSAALNKLEAGMGEGAAPQDVWATTAIMNAAKGRVSAHVAETTIGDLTADSVAAPAKVQVPEVGSSASSAVNVTAIMEQQTAQLKVVTEQRYRLELATHNSDFSGIVTAANEFQESLVELHKIQGKPVLGEQAFKDASIMAQEIGNAAAALDAAAGDHAAQQQLLDLMAQQDALQAQMAKVLNQPYAVASKSLMDAAKTLAQETLERTASPSTEINY